MDALCAMGSVEFTVLSEELRVLRLTQERVRADFSSLLKLLFFTERDDDHEGRFCVCCLVGSELSLIVPACDLPDSLSSDYDPGADTWRAIQLGEGEAGFESVGVIEKIVGPLAAAGVPVLYISTFSTDFVLVGSSFLEEAVSLLRELGEEAAPSAAAAEEAPPASPAPAPPRAIPLLLYEDGATRVYRIDRRRRQEHTSALLRLLFLPAADDEPQPIACLVETPEELSVMCGADSWFGAHCEAHVGDGAQSSSQLWLPIRVGGADGIGLDEVGVIAAMATPLAQASVPVLYVSAFSNDYVLVPAALTDVSVDAFEKQGFDVKRRSAADDVDATPAPEPAAPPAEEPPAPDASS